MASSLMSTLPVSRIPRSSLACQWKLMNMTPVIRRPSTISPSYASQQIRMWSNMRITASVTDSSWEKSTEEAHIPKREMWSVHKFGGAFFGISQSIKNVCDIIVKDATERKLVVVSAMPKVMDMMYELIYKAKSRDDFYLSVLDSVFEKHRLTAHDLLDGDELTGFLSRLQRDIKKLKAMLRAIYKAGRVKKSFTDFVVGHGELWSAQMLAAVVRKNGVDCKWMDSRDIIIVNPSRSNQVDLDFSESEKRLEKWCSQSQSKTIIATGFIASTSDNIPANLKRDGSDFSAAIMGAIVRARQVTIWTDVDGVYGADPRKGCLIRILMDLNWDVLATRIYAVSEAVALRTLSYQEAREMSNFGANVSHPRSIIAATRDDIPILIQNVFNLSVPGTVICRPPENDHQRADSPLKEMDSRPLLNVEGTGMAGVPGTANAIYGTVKDVGANDITMFQRGPVNCVGSVLPHRAAITDIVFILQLKSDANVMKDAVFILCKNHDIHCQVMESYTKEQLIMKLSSGGQRVIIASDHAAGRFLDEIASLTSAIVIGVPIRDSGVTGVAPEELGMSPKHDRILVVGANDAMGAARCAMSICAFAHPGARLGSVLGLVMMFCKEVVKLHNYVTYINPTVVISLLAPSGDHFLNDVVPADQLPDRRSDLPSSMPGHDTSSSAVPPFELPASTEIPLQQLVDEVRMLSVQQQQLSEQKQKLLEGQRILFEQFGIPYPFPPPPPP